MHRFVNALKGLLGGGREAPGSAGAVRLTGQWRQAHAHLTPFPGERRLGLALESCPVCGKPSALRIKARLQGEVGAWSEPADLLQCEACGEVTLPLDSPHREETIRAVDARLWSRTPVVLNLEPTTRCNFECWYCVGRHMEQADLDFENFVRALDHFRGLEVLALVGEGEPFLHKRFFDMAQLARDRGIKVVASSNGSVFSESVIRKVCEAGVTYISISIDSIDPARFASTRIKGDLEKVWRGIEKLVAYRDANGYRYPILGLKGTLFEETRGELLAIAEEAKRRGIEVFEGFQPLNPMSTYIDIYPEDQRRQLASAPELRKTVYDTVIAGGGTCGGLVGAWEMAAREGMRISSTGQGNGLRPNCDEEWIYSLLSGDVTPCCQIKRAMSPRWNLFTHPLDEVLADHDYENLRFNLWNGILMNACEGCWKLSEQR